MFFASLKNSCALPSTESVVSESSDEDDDDDFVESDESSDSLAL